MSSPQVSIALLQADVKRMSGEIAELTVTIEKLVEVDLSLRLLIRAIKWLAAVATGVAAAWAAWRH